MAIKNVTIIGVGLIGGSLGISIKDLGLTDKITGVSRSEEHLKRAVEKKAIDEWTTDPAAAVKNADLVVITTPIQTIIPMLERIAPALKDGAIITDVGSAKQKIVEEAEKVTPEGCFFVGSHPMAGSERSGIEAARTFLFDNAAWVFTPTENTNMAALDELKEFLGKLDIRPMVMEPAVHDKVVAAISHLPYMAACALVKLLADEQGSQEEMLAMAASGFRDTTRVAASPAEWGRDISATNKQALLESIQKLKHSLEDIETTIEKGDESELLKIFAGIQKFREGMY